jgi:hypothetical protein
MDKNKQNTASNSSPAQKPPTPQKLSLGQRILGLFREPPPPDYRPPAPSLPPRQVFIPGRAPFQSGPYLFTDITPTYGCTRGHNQDIINLGNHIKEFQQAHPGVPIPYDRR